MDTLKSSSKTGSGSIEILSSQISEINLDKSSEMNLISNDSSSQICEINLDKSSEVNLISNDSSQISEINLDKSSEVNLISNDSSSQISEINIDKSSEVNLISNDSSSQIKEINLDKSSKVDLISKDSSSQIKEINLDKSSETNSNDSSSQIKEINLDKSSETNRLNSSDDDSDNESSSDDDSSSDLSDYSEEQKFANSLLCHPQRHRHYGVLALQFRNEDSDKYPEKYSITNFSKDITRHCDEGKLWYKQLIRDVETLKIDHLYVIGEKIYKILSKVFDSCIWIEMEYEHYDDEYFGRCDTCKRTDCSYKRLEALLWNHW